MKGDFYFDTPTFFVSEDFSLHGLFLRQPVAVVPCHFLVGQVGGLAFLHGDEAAAMRVVLERGHTGIAQMTELHLLHVNPGHTLRA